MSVFVFLGPSLPVDRARELLDAVYLPPIQQGDVLRVLRRGPTVIGIVDGYFDTVPAVWHKEILTAMAAGVHVFGAASMGALRAAELHPFGMIGVGRVFEWYRDGVLTADDEVAVAHGPRDTGYRSSCDALVDIRDACDAAAAEGVLPGPLAARLVAIARSMPYPERSCRAVAERARAEGVDGGRLEQWLDFVGRRGAGRKQRDAEAMLVAIASFLKTSPGRKQVDYQLERTVFLEQLRHEVALSEVAGPDRAAAHDGERLRAGQTRATLRERQLLRLLARREAERLGWQLTTDEVQDLGDRFRVERGLASPDATRAWMEAEGLSEAAFWRHVQDACLIERLHRMHAQEVEAGLPDELRIATAGHHRSSGPPTEERAATRPEPGRADPDGVVRGAERLAVVRKKVLLRLLAAREATRLGLAIAPEDIERVAWTIREASRLDAADRWATWLAAEHMSEQAFLAAVREFVAVEQVEAFYAREIERAVPEHIRINALRAGWSGGPSR